MRRTVIFNGFRVINNNNKSFRTLFSKKSNYITIEVYKDSGTSSSKFSTAFQQSTHTLIHFHSVKFTK